MRVVSHNSSPISSIVCAAVLAALFAFCHSAQAQQKSHVPRIGYLTVTSLSANKMRVEAFRQGLRELGYHEGRNIIVEWRSGAGKANREDELVAEALRLNVDVIISSGPTMTRAAKQATSIIPIVMAFDSDPIGNRFVASLARPGGNINGLSAPSPELAGKQVELLKEVLPRIARIAILGNSDEPANQNTLNEIGVAARAMSVQVQSVDVRGTEDIKTALAGVIKSHTDAVIVVPSLVFTDKRAQLANLVLQARLPSIYFRQEFVEAGGLMSYAPSFTDLSRRAASYVDKILKGIKPADLPVEQPTKFELVINLKSAKQIGLPIPPNVLARADRVIK